MPEEEKIKMICGIAAAIFPAIYKNRRAVSHDTYGDIVNLVADTATSLYIQTYKSMKSKGL